MTISIVTREKLKQKCNYRAQLNVNQHLWAFIYNPISDYYGPEEAERIRNKMVEAVELVIRNEARERKGDQGFQRYLEGKFLPYLVESELREIAREGLTKYGLLSK